MNRRDFLRTFSAAGVAAGWPLERAGAAATATPGVSTQSRSAFYELLDTLRDVDVRYLGPERRIDRPEDIADGHRFVLQVLWSALDLISEADPERPVFRRTVWPELKFLGDNPDAVYYTAYIRSDRAYRIRGKTAGAVYTSFSLELGTADGHYSKGVARAINDSELKPAADGSYELILSPEPRPGNWFKLEPGTGSVQTRHYFEEERSVAADPSKVIPLTIEALDVPGPRAARDDTAIAASIRRVITYVRAITLDQPPMMQQGKVPSWVSTVPNQFNQPAIPSGDIGFANRDAAYAMAPYALKPDEALVIDGRFPKCRFANVVLWNRYLQTYDYVTHTVSLNRKQTKAQPDGSFRMVVAHRTPGVPNWLDTQGHPSGLIYWRFALPEETVPPLKARVVPVSKVTST
ncbi:MAG: hypothetical protein H6Q33_4255 [Deltaproteobacteria bacterium]|nr:hypothetical protein [Deltaproteobacteria bacterium]